MRLCPSCATPRQEDSFSNGRDVCFACHAKGVQVKRVIAPLGFLAPSDGLTVKQWGDRERARSKARLGYECEPVGKAPYAGPVTV